MYNLKNLRTMPTTYNQNLTLRKTLLFILLFIIGLSAEAQNTRKVSGEVTSNDGQPLAGVSVKIKGKNVGTITDASGNFSISVSTGDTLIFSFLGYQQKEVTVQNNDVIRVELFPTTTELNQIVVVGYGTVKKSDLTGSVATLGTKEIEAKPVSDVLQAMQGQVAGVDITSKERPGVLGGITIRGVRSLTASNAPLFVVDGVPLITGDISYLNPNDIESINILKDASATAIYGSRGANGVILITTKQGKEGQLRLNYSGSITIEKLVDNAPMMNAQEYITWRRWAYYYSNPLIYPRGDQPTRINDSIIFLASVDPYAWANIKQGWQSGIWDGSKVKSTCWTCMVTQTGLVNEHTLSLSGGNDKIKTYASFGYLNNVGTSKGQSYYRYSTNGNILITPNRWFSFQSNLNISYSKQEYGQSNTGRTAITSTSSIYQSARNIYEYAVPYDSNGNRIIYPGGDQAVKTVVNEWEYSTDERIELRAMGSMSAEINIGKIIPILDGLSYKINFGPDFQTYRDGIYIDGQSVIRNGTSYASLSKDFTFSYTIDNLIYYNKSINKNSLNLTLLQTQTAYNDENSSLSAENIPFASQKWNALTPENVPNLLEWSSGLTQQQLMSYMGRVNYSYNEKYLLTISGRWDGASQLAPGHKWSFFPSTAIAWRISEEKFTKNIKWLNELKLRIGIGTTGNAAIAPYATKGAVNSLFYPFGSSIVQGSIPSSTLANQKLGWEKTTQYNVGIDFNVLNSRLSGNIDIYKTETKDLLMSQSIPTVTGFTTTYANVGKTSNKGIDVLINSRNINTKNLIWTSTLNLSYHKDKIIALANGNQNDINNGWFIGEPIGVIYGFKASGLWHESDSSIMNKYNANGSNFQPGMVRPVDQNGDFKIDANHDRVIIGNTLPKWVIGFTNDIQIKNIELMIFLYGRLGYVYNTGGEAQTGRFNQRKINYYNEDNKNAEYQKPIYTVGTGDIYYQSLGYKNGSFIEIKNISLAYNIPYKIITRWKMQNFKIYAQVANAGMLFTRIKFINMDVLSSWWNRGYTIGINVTF